MATRADTSMADLILHYADLGKSKEEFLATVEATMGFLADRREENRNMLEQEKKSFESIYQSPLSHLDDLGLPLPKKT